MSAAHDNTSGLNAMIPQAAETYGLNLQMFAADTGEANNSEANNSEVSNSAASHDTASKTPTESTSSTNSSDSQSSSLLGTTESGEEAKETLLGGTPKDEKPNELVGAPEDYGDFTFPEGQQPPKEIIDAYKSLAKQMNLSKAGAQKLIDFSMEHANAQAKAALAEWHRTADEWRTQTINLFGANNVNKELAYAAKVIDNYLSPEERTELRQFFNDTRLGDHPLLVKLLVAVGKTIAEPQVAHGTPRGASDESLLASSPEKLAEFMYPTMRR